jgi:hypothetical protein
MAGSERLDREGKHIRDGALGPDNLRCARIALEAGGTDDVPSVREPGQWPADLRTERDWRFEALPNPLLNDRRLPLPSIGSPLATRPCFRSARSNTPKVLMQSGIGDQRELTRAGIEVA